MKQKLCLHGLEVKHQAQLLNLLKKFLPGANVSYKVKEKYFPDNDMYKYRRTRFTSTAMRGLRVSCAWGVLLVSDKLQQIADIIFEFDTDVPEQVAEVERLVARFTASRTKFVLEEPSFSQRIDQLRGCYELRSLAAYDEEEAQSMLRCHLPWQVYYISKLWSEVLLRGTEKPLMRQLRVKLRRLRSTLTFCKPLLPEQEATHWQGVLKARTNLLSDVRECDVALLTCAKLSGAQGEDAVPQLTAILQKRRGVLAAKAFKGLKLNRLTLELAQFLLWLYSVPKQESTQSLAGFISNRFTAWYEKILVLPEKYPDLHDMEQLHRIRIKLKRFRYALQSVPELKASPRLLRSLKYLQDMLGLLHDDYINNQMVEQLVAAHPKVSELRYEGAMFAGWEQAKADAAVEALPQQWDNFCELLSAWKEENL